jgi:catechol 2,3-dioxygenase-like lactoylglutathione lyase family enzyme
MSSQNQRPVARGVHHVGMSVRSLDEALAFWEPFLGVQARWHTVLDRPYLGHHVGYPGIKINAAVIDLPGDGALELLEYLTEGRIDLPDATANPGNVHLCLAVGVCLAVGDATEAWERAVECGAVPVVPEGPVSVDAGPNLGARVSYLRIHDGITLEMFQSP